MTVTEYLQIIRRQWALMTILTMAVLTLAAAYTYTRTPVYSASVQLFVQVTNADSDVADLQSGSTFTQQRVKTYADIVTSPYVLTPVIRQVVAPYDAEELARNMTVDTPPDTVLLNVAVRDPSRLRALQLASAIATQFPKFTAEIETPLGRRVSPVKISVTKPAVAERSPTSPRVPLNLAIGLFAGLGLAFGVAVLRDQLNTKVSGVRDVETVTGSIPLGVVPFDPSATSRALVDADNLSGRAEAFRSLRTNLQFANVDDPPRVIVITSALPGDGKTTTSINLAQTLALGGARVVLVEGDLRKPSIGRALGITNAVGVTSILAGQHELSDVMTSFQDDNLMVLLSGATPPNPSELLGSHQMVTLLSSLSETFDYVIVDAPPLLPVTDAAILAAASDGAVLVARHGKTHREELERAVQALRTVNAKLLGTVLNAAPKKSGAYEGYGYGVPTTGRGPDVRPMTKSSGTNGTTRNRPAAARPSQAASDVFPGEAIEGPAPARLSRRRDR